MPSATPATAKPPFNFPSSASADVLIRTADNVNFYLLKAVLTQASPFFIDMFSIQQPELPIASGAILDTEDPIPVTENSQTFDYLMRLCYPVDYPVIKDLSLVESVLEAAIKYQMSEAAQLSRAMLRTFVQAEPLDVYAISCRLDVGEEAQLAAGAWKTTSFFRGYASQFEQTLVGASFGAKMRTITAGQYYRLLHYLCMRPPSMVRFIDGGDPTGSRNVATASGSSHKWNATPLHDTTKTDAVLISQDGVKFPVHSAVLYAASAGELMDPLLAELQPSVEPHTGSPPSTFPVDLPSDVLAELVRLCYPMERFNITDLSLLCPVYAAAVKWRITRISSVIRNEFDTFIKRHPNPISLYFIAVMQGWRAEAELAARVIAQKGLQHLYAREMEDSCATTYYHLLRFCHDSSVSVEAKLSNLTLSCTLLQRSPPSAKSLTYTIIANEVTGLSPRSAQSSSKFCSHGYFQDNCPYACSLKKRFADLLEQGRRWEQRFTELLSEPKVKLRFHLE